MRKTFLWCQVLALFFCLLSVSSTNTRADEPQRFQIGLDYASFREYADAAQSYVEIYYSFNRKQLEFVSTDEGLVATVLMQLSVSDEEGNEVINRMWNTMSRVEDAGDAKSIDYLIIDQVGIDLKPGDYRIRLKATDVNSMAFGEVIYEARVQEFSTQKLQLSDL